MLERREKRRHGEKRDDGHAMRPFLLRRREIPCLCLLVRGLRRERLGMRLGDLELVFSEGVVVIGGASGCLIRWRWTLGHGGGTARGCSDRGLVECSLVSGKNMMIRSDKPLLSFILYPFMSNWIVLFCLDTISCGMSHVVLLSFISSHAFLLLCFSFISLPISPYLYFSSLCLAV